MFPLDRQHAFDGTHQPDALSQEDWYKVFLLCEKRWDPKKSLAERFERDNKLRLAEPPKTLSTTSPATSAINCSFKHRSLIASLTISGTKYING